jgi:hypothetical protein
MCSEIDLASTIYRKRREKGESDGMHLISLQFFFFFEIQYKDQKTRGGWLSKGTMPGTTKPELRGLDGSNRSNEEYDHQCYVVMLVMSCRSLQIMYLHNTNYQPYLGINKGSNASTFTPGGRFTGHVRSRLGKHNNKDDVHMRIAILSNNMQGP